MPRGKKFEKKQQDNPNHSCSFVIQALGTRCAYQRVPKTTRCSEHPIDLFPDPEDKRAQEISLRTFEEIRDLQSRIINEIYRDDIDPAKGKAIIEALKAQVVILEKIWERSPEGREASLEQVQKILIMARGLDTNAALELLMHENFGGMLEYQSRLTDVEVLNDADREQIAARDALLEGAIPGFDETRIGSGLSELSGAASIGDALIPKDDDDLGGSEADDF